MKYTKYSRYEPGAADDIDLQDLMDRLSDFFLQSGFHSQYGFHELDMERARQQHMDDLREAILRALEDGDLIPPELLEKLRQNPDLSQNEELRNMIDQIIQRMEEEGFITQQQSAQVTPPPSETPGGQIGKDQPQVEARFEITDKALDFLGFKTLKDLLASLGKSSFGRHDTRDLATGIESGGMSKAYEFGDTLNMDISGTLFNAVRRNGAGHSHRAGLSRSDGSPVRISKLLRDGADARLQPQHDSLRRRPLYAGEARGAGAVPFDSHAISGRFLHWCCSTTRGGNSARGTWRACRSARTTRIRAKVCGWRNDSVAQKKDMRQIVMITDGKPSALTLEDGRIYKNAFGLDPLVVTQTLEEVASCKRRDSDQHVHAGQRLQPGPFRAESHRALPRQSVLHHSVHPRTVPLDGLRGTAKTQEYPLTSG